MSPQGAVLEGVRATVANRLAGDGDSWTSIFSRWLQLLSTRDPGVNSVVQVQQRHLQQPVDGGQHEPLHSPGNKQSFYSALTLPCYSLSRRLILGRACSGCWSRFQD